MSHQLSNTNNIEIAMLDVALQLFRSDISKPNYDENMTREEYNQKVLDTFEKTYISVVKSVKSGRNS